MNAKRVWFLFGLACVVLITYSGVSHHEFVQYDDGEYLFQNYWTSQGLTWEAVRHFLTTTTGGQYAPVTMISFLPWVSLFGMSAPAQIWVNVALHIANCLLVVWVLQKYTGSFWRPAAVAVLLALHPLHVESVAWATERKDVLFMFFGLLSLGFYADYAKKPGAVKFALALGFYVLSMLSKAMLMTMPVVLLLLDLWPLGRVQAEGVVLPALPGGETRMPWWKLGAEKLPFLGVGIAMFLVTKSATLMFDVSVLGWGARASLAINGYFDYLAALVWPAGLCGLYPIPKSFDTGVVAGKLAVLLAITGLCVWQWRRRPYLLVGWLWYGVTLLPVCGLTQGGAQARADRFVYWPFLGVYLALVWLAWEFLASRRPGKAEEGGAETVEGVRPQVAQAGLVGICAVGVVLAGLSWRQLEYWKNSETFFTRILDVTRDNNLARGLFVEYLMARGRTEEALPHLKQQLLNDPEDMNVLVSMANVMMQTGRNEEALELVQRALRVTKPSARSAAKAGLILFSLGQNQRAEEVVRKALALSPNDLDVLTYGGAVLVGTGHAEEGLGLMKRATEIAPGDLDVMVNLGSAYGNLGRYDEAERVFKSVVNLQPGGSRGYQQLGLLYLITGRNQEAAEVFRKGLAVAPGDVQLREGLRKAEGF